MTKRFRQGRTRAHSLSILLALVLALKTVAIAAGLAAPAHAHPAAPGADHSLQAALSYICTATGAKVLPGDEHDGKAGHPRSAGSDCPLCASAGFHALPCVAILLPPPLAKAQPLAVATAIDYREPPTLHSRSRAPPPSIPA